MIAGLIVDLFAGAGGWDEGAWAAGHTGPLVGLEWDLPACRTAMAAGHARVCADVAGYPTGPFEGKAWGLCGSPPCPTWSAAGLGAGKIDEPLVRERIRAFAQSEAPPVREWTDERSMLTTEPMRWAVATRPRWIALEQVPPVLPLWQYTAHLLRGLGYHVWCGILSAEMFGVPQTRKRAILIASLDGPVGPPPATHQAYRSGREPVTEPNLFVEPLPAPVAMADVLGWGLPEQPSPVVMTARGRQSGASDALRGSSWRAEWWTRQNMVMRRGNAVDWVADDKPVRVTVAEAGILQSFRAGYPWTGTKTQQYQMVGNCIPPLLAKAILQPLIATRNPRCAA